MILESMKFFLDLVFDYIYYGLYVDTSLGFNPPKNGNFSDISDYKLLRIFFILLSIFNRWILPIVPLAKEYYSDYAVEVFGSFYFPILVTCEGIEKSPVFRHSFIFGNVNAWRFPYKSETIAFKLYSKIKIWP